LSSELTFENFQVESDKALQLKAANWVDGNKVFFCVGFGVCLYIYRVLLSVYMALFECIEGSYERMKIYIRVLCVCVYVLVCVVMCVSVYFVGVYISEFLRVSKYLRVCLSSQTVWSREVIFVPVYIYTRIINM